MISECVTERPSIDAQSLPCELAMPERSLRHSLLPLLLMAVRPRLERRTVAVGLGSDTHKKVRETPSKEAPITAPLQDGSARTPHTP